MKCKGWLTTVEQYIQLLGMLDMSQMIFKASVTLSALPKYCLLYNCSVIVALMITNY